MNSAKVRISRKRRRTNAVKAKKQEFPFGVEDIDSSSDSESTMAPDVPLLPSVSVSPSLSPMALDVPLLLPASVSPSSSSMTLEEATSMTGSTSQNSRKRPRMNGVPVVAKKESRFSSLHVDDIESSSDSSSDVEPPPAYDPTPLFASKSLSSKQKYSCLGCGKRLAFSNRYQHPCYRAAKNLPMHEKTYKCPECSLDVSYFNRSKHSCYRESHNLNVQIDYKCPDCAQMIPHQRRAKHSCYRKTKNLGEVTALQCPWCHLKVSRKTSLLRHLKTFGDRPHDRIKHMRRESNVSVAQLHEPGRFTQHETVLNQRIHRSTSLQVRSFIEKSQTVLSSEDPKDRHDNCGPLSRPGAPLCVVLEASPSSDGQIFQFSRYPKSVKGGDPTGILSLKMDFLHSDDYLLFWAVTFMTQFGRNAKQRGQTHVVFVKKDSPALRFCQENLVELDKRTNQIVFLNDANEWSVATRLTQGVGLKTRGADRRHSVAHRVILAIEGDLSITPEMTLQWIDGIRLEITYDLDREPLFNCSFLGCKFRALTITMLKSHYRAVHTDIRPFTCSKCEKTFARRVSLSKHVRGHAREKRTFPGCHTTVHSPKQHLPTHDPIDRNIIVPIESVRNPSPRRLIHKRKERRRHKSAVQAA